MFTILIWTMALMVGLAMWYAYAQSRDVFHPMMLLGPMLLFLYVWMPSKLDAVGGLDGFFQRDQLDFVQLVNVLGVGCLVAGCLSVECRLPATRPAWTDFSPAALVFAGTLVGMCGLGAWLISLKNIGGITALGEALTTGYGGGWDENGYVRDGSLLLFPAILLLISAGCRQGFRFLYLVLIAVFVTPWALQAAFASRRGPAFMLVATLALGWFLNREKRPPLLLTAGAGMALGVVMLFLVTNRGNIYVGSNREITTDVASIVEKPDTGNEFIYGAGGILSAQQRNSFYWGRRYLAQIVVRPIPSAIWPNKYEDFGMSELTHNAGTGEGFAEILGWEGAVGSAPGVVTDLWLEFWWLNLPALFLLGRVYSAVWRKANLNGGVWIAQYTMMSALSIYLVMQTMEAVIFRLAMVSIPLHIAYRVARREQETMPVQVRETAAAW